MSQEQLPQEEQKRIEDEASEYCADYPAISTWAAHRDGQIAGLSHSQALIKQLRKENLGLQGRLAAMEEEENGKIKQLQEENAQFRLLMEAGRQPLVDSGKKIQQLQEENSRLDALVDEERRKRAALIESKESWIKLVSERNGKIEQLQDRIADLERVIGIIQGHKSDYFRHWKKSIEQIEQLKEENVEQAKIMGEYAERLQEEVEQLRKRSEEFADWVDADRDGDAVIWRDLSLWGKPGALRRILEIFKIHPTNQNNKS